MYMPTELLSSPYGAIIWVVSIMGAFTAHEVAHAFVAFRLGDQTPKKDGRVTLNPFAHIDPLGFGMFLLFGAGWAKPVRFEPSNLRNRNFGSTLVALAGPAGNIFLIILTILLTQIFNQLGLQNLNLQILFKTLILTNIILIVINLIPLPPFDGSKFTLDLIRKVGSETSANLFQKYGPYLAVLLLALDASSVSIVGKLIYFILKFSQTLT